MQSRPDPVDLDTARAAYVQAASRVQDAASDTRLARGTDGYRDAVADLLEAQRAQVHAHRQLRAATAGHRVDPAVLARLDQDGAGLDHHLAQVAAELDRLDQA